MSAVVTRRKNQLRRDAYIETLVKTQLVIKRAEDAGLRHTADKLKQALREIQSSWSFSGDNPKNR